MNEIAAIVLMFLCSILGLMGKTWRPERKHLMKLSPLGWTTSILLACALIINIQSQILSSEADDESQKNLKAVTKELIAVRAELSKVSKPQTPQPDTVPEIKIGEDDEATALSGKLKIHVSKISNRKGRVDLTVSEGDVSAPEITNLAPGESQEFTLNGKQYTLYILSSVRSPWPSNDKQSTVISIIPKPLVSS